MYIIKNTKTIFFLALMLLFFSFASVDVFANSYDTPVADANAAMEHAQEMINILEKKIIDTKKEHQELEMSGIERDVQSAQEQLIESNRLFRLGKYYQAQLAANQAHRLASLGGEELEKYIEDSLGIDQEGEFKSYGSYGDQSFTTEEDYIQYIIDQAGKVAFELQDAIIDFDVHSKIPIIPIAYDALDEAYQLVELAESEYEKGNIDRVRSYTQSAIEIAEDALVDVRELFDTLDDSHFEKESKEELVSLQVTEVETKTSEAKKESKEEEKEMINEADLWAMPEWDFEFKDGLSEKVATVSTGSKEIGLDLETYENGEEEKNTKDPEEEKEDVVEQEEDQAFFKRILNFFWSLF